jgi:hypothetical protein
MERFSRVDGEQVHHGSGSRPDRGVGEGLPIDLEFELAEGTDSDFGPPRLAADDPNLTYGQRGLR